MNTIVTSKRKITKNDSDTNKILISEILKKKSIGKSNSNSSSNSPNRIIPKFLNNTNQNSEILKSNSIKSSSTEISDNSPTTSPIIKPEESTNYLITNIIMKEIKNNNDFLNYYLENDTEFITDKNITLNLKKEIIDEKLNEEKLNEEKLNDEKLNDEKLNDEKLNEEDNIDKNIQMQLNSIYEPKSDDLVILSNLTLLSKIQPTQKLFVIHQDTNNKIDFELKIDDSFVSNLTRWYYNQGRNETIEILNKLIDISTEQLNMHMQLNNTVEISNYRNLLQSSVSAINNLKTTYSSDKNILIQLDLIIEKINKLVLNILI